MAWHSKGEFKRSLALVAAGALVTGIGTVGGEVVKHKIDGPAQITCSSEYARYGELKSKFPHADLKQPADSEIEKQCHINEFIDDVNRTPAQVQPSP